MPGRSGRIGWVRVIAGGLNVFQFLGWIIAMALYCAGFAGYLQALLPWETPDWSAKAIGIGLIVAVVIVNLIGTGFVGLNTDTAPPTRNASGTHTPAVVDARPTSV